MVTLWGPGDLPCPVHVPPGCAALSLVAQEALPTKPSNGLEPLTLPYHGGLRPLESTRDAEMALETRGISVSPSDALRRLAAMSGVHTVSRHDDLREEHGQTPAVSLQVMRGASLSREGGIHLTQVESVSTALRSGPARTRARSSRRRYSGRRAAPTSSPART